MNETGDWPRLTDAYGDTYDPRPALDAIGSGNAGQAYDELWQRAQNTLDFVHQLKVFNTWSDTFVFCDICSLFPVLAFPFAIKMCLRHCGWGCS